MVANPCPPRRSTLWPQPFLAAVGLVVVGGAFVLAGGATLAAGPADDLKLAVAHYNGKRHEEAAASFELYLKAAPRGDVEIPTARFFLGLSQVNLEKHADARKTLRDFLRDFPKDEHVADAWYQIAWCSYLLGDQEAAAREFQSFLENHEKHDLAEWALVYLGDAQLQLNEHDAAARSFRRSLDAFPQGAMAEDARMGLARAYELQKKFDEAIVEYRTVADDPRGTRRAEARFALAGRLYDGESFGESAKEYDTFIAAFDSSTLLPAARMNAGYAHFKAGDFAAAIERFDAAAADPEQTGTARYWSGLALRERGENDKASDRLAEAFEAAKEGPEAPTILYQWADTEFLRGEYASAAKLFTRLSDDWPNDDRGDDALHEAGNAALRSGDVNEAIRLVNLFEQRYGDRGPLAVRQQILTARIELARGRDEDVRRAEKRLEVVLRATQEDAVADHARYELARARYRLDDHAGVVQALEPLLPRVKLAGEGSPYLEAFVLASESRLAAREYAAADEAAGEYLSLAPTGSRATRATANRALARARLGEREAADAHLTALVALEPEPDLLRRTRFDIGEIAYDAGAFDWASNLYAGVLGDGFDTPLAPLALNGLAWSEYQRKQFAEAATRFRAFVERYGDDPRLGPEARYMLGKSLQDDGQEDEAARAFETTFTRYAPSTPAAAGAETQGSTQYAYKSGLQAARLYHGANDVPRADAAYERVHATFPGADLDDRLLDEWALLNYEAERYVRADELFRKLLDEHPRSERADDARFHLAESALIAGRNDEARRAFTSLAADERADDYVRELSAFHLLEMDVTARDWKAVGERSQKLVETYPQSRHVPLVRFRRAEALVSLDPPQNDEAKPILTGLLEETKNPGVAAEPWFARVRLLLAEIAFREKAYDTAVEQVNELVAEQPRSPFLYQARELLGRVYKQQAKFVEARAEFAKVVDDQHGAKTETAAKAQFLLAETHLVQKDYRNARREYFKVATLYDFPQWQAVGLFQSGRCDEALGDVDAARKAYEDLLAKYPESEHAAEARDRLRVVRSGQ